MTNTAIRRRAPGNPDALPTGLHPVLRRIYASRGVQGTTELALDLKALLPPHLLLGIDDACAELSRALRENLKVVVAGDYDADGATSTALAVSALRAMGAQQVDYVVPDRFRLGYGLTPGLVEEAKALGAQVLVTVDNGIASHAGVAAARAAGMRVVITDHHLAGAELPDANAIVNPNQPGDPFPSKHLAGVGVMFYVLMALRTRLRDEGWFKEHAEPKLADFLDLVALGTVADVVRLDHNNRVLVTQGLLRMRAGRARPGIAALMQISGRRAEDIFARDLAFALGPRLNAAGRLEDMRIGIRCLLSESEGSALQLAQELDQLNRDRRELEGQMREEAYELVDGTDDVGVCLFDPGWHEGVVGLIASRIKEKKHRPAIAFARAQEGGLLKGSARSIAGLHIRDALAAVDAGHPGLIERFGGHAMAAGVTLREERYAEFAAAFDRICRAWLDAASLERFMETDGALADGEFSLDTARVLQQGGPWGQGFAEPCFDGRFRVESARRVGELHVKYRLRTDSGLPLQAIHFRGAEAGVTGGAVELVYRLSINRYSGLDNLELLVEHLTPV